MNCTFEIRKHLLKDLRVDMVGFAPVSVLEDEPEGHRPSEILPGAKSIIVFGKRIADGALQAAFRRREDNNQDAESTYAAYGNELLPSFHLLFTQFNLANFIERNFGKTAVAIPCNPMHAMSAYNHPKPLFTGGVVSEYIVNVKKAAVAAGLGEIGWSNYFLTPEYGPRQQFGIVITTLELEYDQPYTGEKLCDPARCGICVSKCPTCALSSYEEGGETMEVAGTCQTMAKQNINACAVASSGFRSEFTGKVKVPDQIMNNDPSDEELAAAYAEKPFAHWGVSHYPNHYCNNCLLYCPVGRWKERFYDKGLSKFNPEEVVKNENDCN